VSENDSSIILDPLTAIEQSNAAFWQRERALPDATKMRLKIWLEHPPKFYRISSGHTLSVGDECSKSSSKSGSVM
jgi:hypothetical protein